MPFSTSEVRSFPVVPDDDGYIDFTFNVFSVDATSAWVNLGCMIEAELGQVGFELRAARRFPWGHIQEPEMTFNPKGWIELGVELRSIGEPSDRFLRLLASLFDVKPLKINGNQKDGSLALSGYSFAPTEIDVAEAPSRIKLAHDAYNQDDAYDEVYWQAFIHLDPVAGTLRLEEKDQTYRQAQINTLWHAWGMS